MASSCCWLPPILILAGVSGAGMSQALESYRVPFMVVTFGFLGIAFYFTYRPRRANAGGTTDAQPAAEPNATPAPPVKRRFNMMAMNKVMLWAVTVMAVLFLFFPQSITGLFAADDEFTSDMQRTVLVVEGMTCEG